MWGETSRPQFLRRQVIGASIDARSNVESTYTYMGRKAMIHHVSIPARDPRHVAEVLAELMKGQCHAFGPLEGAFMAMSGDPHGSMIEVYPERTALGSPSNGDPFVFGENAEVPKHWPFHMLLSVPLDREEVERIGAR